MSGGQLSLGLEEARIEASDFFDPVRTPLENGITLIEASAGTGKTRSIILTALRLLLERSADGTPRVGDISRVLVVTFTVAATDELITRMRETLRKAVAVFSGSETERSTNPGLFELYDAHGRDGHALARLRDALARIDQLSIFTIHGFCKRVLEESALESSTAYDFAFVEDESEIVHQAAHDWWRRTMYGNERLAALAVARRWDPRKHVEHLARWRRYPGTTVVPDESVADAMAGAERALDAVARAWDPERVPALLERLHWSPTSPLASPESRALLGEAMAAIASGDWGGALEMVPRCTPDALSGEKTGVQKSSRGGLQALLDDPFPAACTDVEPAVRRLEIALRGAFIRDVGAAFEAEKRRRHVLGFDDLLRRVHDGVGVGGGDAALAAAIRARYDAALIDEFQDTDAFQYPIFATAFRDRPLFLIGDPKQAIYSFRGADISVYMRAAAAASRRYTLRNNHRSTTALVHAVNLIFERAGQPFLEADDRIGYVPVAAASTGASPLADGDTRSFCWWTIPAPEGKSAIQASVAEDHFHDAIVHECVRLLGEERAGRPCIHPREIAILVRYNREAIALQRRLRDAGVPSVLRGSGDILLSDEMAELGRVLAAVASPSNSRAVRSAVTTTLWGMDAADLYALSRPHQEHAWQRLVEVLADARETWRQHGFMRMVQELFARQGVAERLLRLRDGERRLTNLRHAVEQLHAEAEAERLSPDGLLMWLARTREAKPLDAERRELRLESDDDAVQISTIHLSKGLEYGVVFCTSLWSGREEPRREVLVRLDAERVVYDLGSRERDRHARLAAADELAENLRLAYVAITRARYRVYLGLAASSSASRSALGYLLRPPGSGQLEPRDELVQRLEPAVAAAIPRWPDTLQALCASSKGSMSWATLPLSPGERAALRPPPPAAVPLARTLALAAGQLDTWRISSYTRLATGRHAGGEPELDAHGVDPDVLAAMADALPTGFAAFPRGKHSGIVLHSIFEQLDFTAVQSPMTRRLVETALAAGRLATAESAAGDVAGMLAATVESPLPGAGFRLRDVPAAATRREWRFHLPLARVTRQALLEPFERATTEPARSYAPWVRRLGAFDVHGFLTGSVDLLFERHDRWYIVDWKSNDLGAAASSYERPALERAMFASHYTLQYHLYVLALHRHLRARLRDYDYERHIGGVWYAFLRGIDAASERGWYHDRPPRRLIDALDETLLEGGTP